MAAALEEANSIRARLQSAGIGVAEQARAAILPDKKTDDSGGEHRNLSDDYLRQKKQMESLLGSMQVAHDRLLNALGRCQNNAHFSKLQKQETALARFIGSIQHYLSAHPVEGCHSMPPVLHGVDILLHDLLNEELHHNHGQCDAHAAHAHAQQEAVLPAHIHRTVLDGIYLQDEFWGVRNAMEDLRFAVLLSQTGGADEMKHAFHAQVEQAVHAATAPTDDAKTVQEAVEKEFAGRWQWVEDAANRLRSHRCSVQDAFEEHVASRWRDTKTHMAEFLQQHPDASEKINLHAVADEIQAMDAIINDAHTHAAQDPAGAAEQLHHDAQTMDAHCAACNAEISQSLMQYARERFQAWVNSNKGKDADGPGLS